MIDSAAPPTLAGAAGGDASRHWCYSCNGEVLVVERPDFELECSSCKATCVELLEEAPANSPASAAAPAPPPPPPFDPFRPPRGAQHPRRVVVVDPPDGVSDATRSPHAAEVPPRAHVGGTPAPQAIAGGGGGGAAAAAAAAGANGQRLAAQRRHRGIIGQGGGRRGQQATRHVGIICDGCNARDFVGVRYKCLHCPDFDFCAACHAQRSALHPGHDFEMIVTPRGVVPPFIADFLARAAARTSVAIIGIGVGGAPEASSGLDDRTLAWWLADSRRLVSVEQMAEQDPSWCCPICAEGLEAEGSNGWVVQICGSPVDGGGGGGGSPGPMTPPVTPPPGTTAAEALPPPLSAASSSTSGSEAGGEGGEEVGSVGAGPGTAVAAAPPAVATARDAEEEEEMQDLQQQSHVYHEACLRRWLLKSNSCPVCRRTPVVPEA